MTRDAALGVANASHPLVRDSLAIEDLVVVAYAGVPRRTSRGKSHGTLRAIDVGPAQWTAAPIAGTDDLPVVAMAEIEWRGTEYAPSQARSR